MSISILSYDITHIERVRGHCNPGERLHVWHARVNVRAHTRVPGESEPPQQQEVLDGDQPDLGEGGGDDVGQQGKLS